MKTIAYLDCPSGISGDMCLGALVDAGVPLDYLRHHLGSLGLNDEFTLAAKDVIKRGQRAIQAEVTLTAHSPERGNSDHSHSPGHPHSPGHLHPAEHPHSHDYGHSHDHGHSHDYGPELSRTHSHGTELAPEQDHPLPPSRNLPVIEQLITRADLPERVKAWSLAIFRRLGEAEAAVHGIAMDQVHFHEVGATDAIVDIVGTCLGFDYLQIDTLVCSPLPTGKGRVKTAHGWLPVPAPAVLKLMTMGRVPIYSPGLSGELVTPTGAAIATTLAQGFGDPPPFTLERVGLGAGRKDLPIANMLRLWVGYDSAGGAMPFPQETITVLETQVDDLLPQAVGYLYDQLFAAGALDVFTQPLGMKKSRPGLLITVICPPQCQTACERVLFTETTTLGIRHRQQPRTVLQRRFKTLETPYGLVRIKLGYHPPTQQLMNAHPEYEDCAALAQRYQVPWQVVHQAALAAWSQYHPAAGTPDQS